MANKLNTKDLMNVLVYVLFAVIIIPIIAGQVVLLATDGNISSNPALVALVGLITTFIILGVVYAIVKTIL